MADGYTHRVYFDKYNPKLGMTMKDQHFPTTPDMVHRHVAMLERHPGISNVRAVQIEEQANGR